MMNSISTPNPRRRNRAPLKLLCGASISVLVVLCPTLVADAEERYWDANGSNVGAGGTGNWNTTSAFWSETSSDVLGPYWAWNNSALDNAIFAGTAGTVTLTSPITVRNLTFNTTGYVLNGGVLTLGGTTPTINTSNGGVTIDSVIAGTAGLTKTGTGTLLLTGTNTFSGGITVDAGTLRVDGGAALGALSNAINVTANSGFRIDSGDASNRTVTIASGATLTLTAAATGSARYTGAGNLNVASGVVMNNDSNTYTGTTRLNGAGGGAGNIVFTSVRNLGEASSLGAPTTVENGTILFAGGSQYSDRITYTGTGDSSNRNWVLIGGPVRRLVNQGTGTLSLSGDIAITGSASFESVSAGFDLLGVISGSPSAVTFNASADGGIALGGANTFSGVSSVAGGVVSASKLSDAGVASSFGTGSQINLGNNGVLRYTGTGDSSDRTWDSNGATAIHNNGTGALALGGDLGFNAAAPAGDRLTFGGSYAGTNIFSGVISGAGDLASSGSSLWELTGANTRTGALLVDGGTLRAGAASAFGTVTGVTLNGGVLDLNGFDLEAPSLNGAGGEIALGAGTLSVDNTAANSFAGAITGTGGLIKSGAGALTLTGASTYTGDTTIGGGALNLDFSAAGAPASNILSASSALNMAGGALNLIGADGVANTQDFGGLIVTVGNSRINATSGAGGAMSVNLGAITRTGGLINFGRADSGGFTTTNADGALGGWAMVNNSDYAKVVSGEIVAFDETDYTDKDEAATWANGEFISDADGDADGFSGAVTGSVQLAGLRYSMPVATTVTVDSGHTLGIDGAIIVAPSVDANDQLITGGSLTGGAGGGALGVLQSSAGNFTIASTIIDNGGATGFTKGGAGQVTLSGANTYTGATTLSGGTLTVSTIRDGGVASGIGASSALSSNLVLESGTLQYDGATATTDRGFTLVNGAAVAPAIDVTNGGTNLTFSGLVTSPDDAGLTKTGAGTLTLSNDANDYTGVTTIRSGTLAVNTLADGGLASGIGASSSDSSNLVLDGGEFRYTGGTVESDRGFTLQASSAIGVTDAGATLTLSGIAAGPTGFTKTGDGTLELSGNNTFGGNVIVNGGTLRAGSNQAFGSGTMTVNAATLDLDGFSNSISGLRGAGAVSLGTATLTIGPGFGSSFSGTISGAGGVTKNGSGMQTMTGCNSDYTGATTISGTLSVDCLADGGLSSAIGGSDSASSNLVLIGGRLTYTGASESIDRGFTLQSGNGFINVDAGTTTLEFEGVVAGGGALHKEGAGVLVLSGANTYTGNTRVIGGVLSAGVTNALGPSGHMTLDNTAGVLLDLDDHDTLVTSLIGGGANGGNIDLGSGTLTISAVDARAYAGAISGTGNLVMTANNAVRVQELTGCSSTYDGTTTINSGVLAVSCLTDGGLASSIGDSGAGAGNLVLNGGTLRYDGAGGSTDRLFTLGSSANSKIEASGTGAIAFTNTGAIAFSSPDTAQTIRLGGTNTGNNSFALQISNNAGGVTSFTKEDAGTWILTNPGSTYTGVTSILGGVLGVDKLTDGDEASSIGMSSNAASNLVIGNGGTLRYTGAGDTTDRRFTLAAGTTAIQSSGSGAIEFTNTAPIAYSSTGARVVSLGGTNADDNVMGAAIGDQNATNITSLAKNDAGRWILTGDNAYTGSTNINAGTLILGNGGTTGSVASATINNFGALGFNRSDTLTYGGLIQGSGSAEQFGAGLTILTGANSYSGATIVSAGSLWINGDQSAATGLTSVASGATLGGIGIIGGDVSVASGGVLAPGNSPGVLTINGDLILDAGSILEFEFGEANVVGGPLNDLIEVGGDLALEGMINVTVSAGGSFDAGLYRVISYAGDLIADAPSIGAMPPGSDVFVQTSVTGQVNLVNTAGLDVNLWDGGAGPKFDGAVNGGDGFWQNGGGNDNWADIDGFVNLPWIDDAFAIFTATAGTVTVDDSLGAVTASGMQFASDGYLVTGDPVGLVGPQSTLRVGDGTAAGFAMTATIDSQLTGASEVVKTDLGRLVLGGANTYTGGTRIGAGVLSVSADANLGALAGAIVFDGGALQSTGTFSTARNAALDVAGTFLPDGGTTLTLSGLVSGIGSLEKAGAGTLVFASDNTYAGGTEITAGTLQLGAGGTTGSLIGDVTNGGVLAFNRSDELSFDGSISGSGVLSQIGAGTTILTAENSYTGGTIISAGALQLGDGGVAGAIVGSVINNSLFAFNRSDNIVFAGLISGTGALSQIGSGTTILTGVNSYTGATEVASGTLLINGDQSAATGLTNVASGAALGGNGIIGGDVTVADGGVLIPGSNDVGALTVSGVLALSDTSRLDYEFGQSGVVGGPLNDLIEVGGDLTLDGIIDVTVSPGGVFDVGLYRVIGYDGALTDNTLDLGAMPPGSDVFVQTAIANQVNLVNTAGLDLNFWDGAAGPKFDNAVNGGDGLWQASGDDNWTDLTGALNAVYEDGAFAIFSAGAGTVTVDNSLGAISTAGMQFASDGYVITGDSVDLTGPQSIVRVGDGTVAGLTMAATIESVLTGSSQLVKTDLGTLILSGVNAYTGGTIVDAGTLLVNGDSSAATGLTTVNAATLGGTGVIGGDVAIAGGAITPGSNGVGTLTIAGGLSLDSASSLNMEFGEAGVVGGARNDLIEVGGDLVLDGTINVTEPAGGSFGIGIYRILNYAGGLTDNGLEIGSMPGGSSAFVQTSVANQINLINAGGLTLSFWDGDAGPKFNGVVDGGDGVWQASGGNDNWASEDGVLNAPYADGTYAIFSGVAGAVTVDNSLGDVIASGMQFATDGYAVGGESIFLTGPQATVRVGDGTAAGERMTATIATDLSGSTQLVKTDLGTLILEGTNSYTGGTEINGGTLQISTDVSLGTASGVLTFSGGALRTTADIHSNRDLNLAADGVFLTDTGTALTLNGILSGAGGVSKNGGGSLILTGDNADYVGAAEIASGVLAVNGIFGGPVDILNGGRLEGAGVVGDVVNRSGATLAPGFGGIGQITVSSYTGNGGVLEIEAELQDDASAADRLIVSGNTLGTTIVSVINRAGLGAQTEAGIKIIEVGGVSDGVFTLDGDYLFDGAPAVVAGAYGYRLYQNGISTPDDGDWYLRSSLVNPDNPGEETPPLYQPGVPLYEAYPQMLAALSETPTLRQRTGARAWRNGVWGRAETSHARLHPDSVTGSRQEGDTQRLETGVDAAFLNAADGDLVGGLIANYAQSAADVSSVFGTGGIDTTAWGVGATLTWHGENGFYLDFQGRANWFDSALASDTAGWEIDNDGKGRALSVELGRRADIGGGFAVTPQMQYVHSAVDFDTFADPFGAVVERGRGRSFRGRAGVALDHHSAWTGRSGTAHDIRGYGIADLKYEFLDEMQVRVTGTDFASGEPPLWGSLGLGGEYSWNKRISFYGETSAETPLSGFGDSRRLTARLGVRAAF